MMIGIKIISILLLMFIFGLVLEVEAQTVKSFKYEALRINTNKLDESEDGMKAMVNFDGNGGGADTKLSFIELGQSLLKPTQSNKTDHFKTRAGLPSLTLLKSNKAELLMLFRLSFDPKEGHVFLEMNL